MKGLNECVTEPLGDVKRHQVFQSLNHPIAQWLADPMGQ
jgi:hypothetical protein